MRTITYLLGHYSLVRVFAFYELIHGNKIDKVGTEYFLQLTIHHEKSLAKYLW